MKDIEIYLSYTSDIPLWTIYLVLLALIFFVLGFIVNYTRYKEVSNKLEELEESFNREVKRKEKIIVDYQKELRVLREIATKPNVSTNSKVGKSGEKSRTNNGRFKAKD